LLEFFNEQETHAVLVEQMIALALVVGGITKDLVDSCGLTDSESQLLWLTDPAVDPVPLRRVATRLHFDPSNVTLISAKLEEKGLVRRAPHPTDGRVRTLVLTVAGCEMRQRLLAGAYARSPFSALDPREQSQLSRLLAKALRREA
jgi:DNA-binding MarR family transcriptional regulator